MGKEADVCARIDWISNVTVDPVCQNCCATDSDHWGVQESTQGQVAVGKEELEFIKK